MKYFWIGVVVLFGLFGSLFLFQNNTRTLSLDTRGYQLSFDLGIWGVGATDLRFDVYTLSVFSVGIIFGLIAPFLYKSLFSK